MANLSAVWPSNNASRADKARRRRKIGIDPDNNQLLLSKQIVMKIYNGNEHNYNRSVCTEICMLITKLCSHHQSDR